MKQTEIVGVEDTRIPDDWEVKTLAEVTINIGDGIHTTPKYTISGSSYFINGNNIKNGNIIIDSDTKKVSNSDAQKYIFPLSENTILMSINGTIGNVAYYKNEPVVLGKSVAYFTTNRLLFPIYLFYILQADEIKKQFENSLTGSTIKNLGLATIRCTLIPKPPLAEQQRIAKALSDVDALISTTEKLIQKKKNIKQGAMQNLLTGKKRLPGFGPQTKSPTYKQTELGPIPDDWEVKNINKECTIKARIGWQGLKSIEYLDSGDYILITGTDFDSGFINWKSCSYVSKWRFDQDKNIQIKRGDVLITKDGTIGKVAFLNEIPMQGTLNSGVFVIRPKNSDKIDSVFLSLIFKSIWFDSFLEQITSGSTIVHLYQKDFVKFDFPLPSKEEQTAIANVLSSMDKEIETLNTKLEKYRNLKTAMMQQLLTGKIRL